MFRFLIPFLLLICSTAQAFDHSAWNTLLATHVKPLRGGVATAVDYQGMKKDQQALQGYLDELAKVTRADFQQWPKEEQLAFLINAYNAFTVELILVEGQPASIRDIGSFLSGPWDKDFFSLFGEPRTLDEVEHEMIRGNPALMDPRIHFAVNCASIGCPALRPEAYTADRLDAQLEDSAKKFLSDNQRNRFNSDTNALEISKIFDWYEEDFETAAGSVAEYLLPYADELGVPEEKRELMKADDFTIRHLDYNWKLNKQ